MRHMNEDHADAVQLYAGKLLGLAGSDWRMTGIDAEGIDLRQGGQVARLAFDAPLGAANEARKAAGRTGGQGARWLIPRRGILFAVARSDSHDPRH